MSKAIAILVLVWALAQLMPLWIIATKAGL